MRARADDLAAERGQQRVQRALAAVGDRAEVRRDQPGALEPAPDRARDLGRAERPLERVGRDEDRALGAIIAASCQTHPGARGHVIRGPIMAAASLHPARPPLDATTVGALQDAVGVLTAKWSLTVLARLAAGTHRFNELLRQIDGVSRRMLSATLRQLERDGLVKRHVYARVPSRVEYELSATGEDLLRALDPARRLGHREPRRADGGARARSTTACVSGAPRARCSGPARRRRRGSSSAATSPRLASWSRRAVARVLVRRASGRPSRRGGCGRCSCGRR